MHHADDMLARITAKRLKQHLEASRFVLMKRPSRVPSPHCLSVKRFTSRLRAYRRWGRHSIRGNRLRMPENLLPDGAVLGVLAARAQDRARKKILEELLVSDREPTQKHFLVLIGRWQFGRGLR